MKNEVNRAYKILLCDLSKRIKFSSSCCNHILSFLFFAGRFYPFLFYFWRFDAGGLVFSFKWRFGCLVSIIPFFFCSDCLFSGHELSSQEPLHCSVVHENGDHQDRWRRRHQIEAGPWGHCQWRRSPPPAFRLDWWCCYPTRLLRLSCRFTFDFLLDWLATHFFFWKKYEKVSCSFSFFLPQWSFQMGWKSGGTASAGLFFIRKSTFQLFFFLLLLLIFTFLFNYNAYYTRVYIDAPPTFFGTTKAIRFFLSRAEMIK